VETVAFLKLVWYNIIRIKFQKGGTYVEIGKLINKKRLELGLTLEEVGNAVGVSKSTVKKWEDGYISNMKRDKISELAKILHLDPVSLITGEENVNSNKKEPIKPTVTDEDIKFALFNGADGVTDEMYEEVKNFADFVKNRKK
jgi:transcriptional regulator with XRE-family HTH domain